MTGGTVPDDLPLATGYRFAGVHCGLRVNEPGRPDLAVVVSDAPASAAGVFTQNRVCAAPVRVSRERLPRGDARGFVVCSGNANACTGAQGIADARRMAELLAAPLGCAAEQVLVCSTGVIGRLLPMGVFDDGIPNAIGQSGTGPKAFELAARAILTTDTRVKVAGRRLRSGSCVTGFAKGAAMIGPNMATMLGFVLTDAAVSPEKLHGVLRYAVGPSFNCVSVEGHTSTNDTVLALANGQGPGLAGAELDEFLGATADVCEDLARQIAGDAEGANHLITVRVEGAATGDDARRIAKAVADSALVKTAVYGADPNWGRVVSAAGYAGADFEEHDLSLRMGPFELYTAGVPQQFDAAAASAYLRDNREVTFHLALTRGSGTCTFWTCDLTPEYVRLNADYTT